jgi:hypothetical protein
LAAPRTTLEAPRETAPRSALRTTSGSSTSSNASKSPSRAAPEGVDDLALGVEVGVGNPVLALDAAASAAGELARRLGWAIDDWRDLIERHREHVVQDERAPLGRVQRLQDHEQRQADGVGQQRLVLGVGAVGAVDDRLRHAHIEGFLAPRSARAQSRLDGPLAAAARVRSEPLRARDTRAGCRRVGPRGDPHFDPEGTDVTDADAASPAGWCSSPCASY